MSGPVRVRRQLLALSTALLVGIGVLLVSSPAEAVPPVLVADQDPIVSGVPQVGATLTAIAGGYDVDPESLSYQWDVDGDPVGIDSPIYRPTADDVGETVTVTVTAAKGGYDEAVTMSDPTVAVWGAGRLVAWGNNDQYNHQTDMPPGLADEPVSSADGGIYHSLALLADGTVTGFGGDFYHQATPPGGLTDVVDLAAGTTHSLAVTSNGHLVTWGDDSYGQLDGPDLSAENIVEAAGGTADSMVLTADGHMFVWDGNNNPSTVVPPAIQGHVVAIASGASHSLALTSDGVVHAWGGTGFDQTTIPDLTGETVVQIAVGDNHSLALTSDGTVVAWGRDNQHQIEVPAGLTDVTSIAAGGDFSIALTADGTVHLWGANSSGRLALPAILDGKTVTAMGTGYAHAFAIYASLFDVTMPAVIGTAQVGQTLTATAGSYDPTPGGVAGAWLRDGTPIAGAHDPTYQLTPDDAGKTITYQETATRAGYADAGATSNAIGPIAPAPAPPAPPAPPTFTTGPTVTVTGDPMVGTTLTAHAGGAVPTADSFSYQWNANGAPITSATGPTHTLTTQELGATITVTATAHLAGYTSADGTSGPVGPVVARPAPTVTLTADHEQLRRGESTTLTWDATDADSLAPGGEWPAGADIPMSGTLTVQPTQLGTHVYELQATNTTRTVTAEVTITVVRPATTFSVEAPAKRHRAQGFVVRAHGLDPSEPFTIRIGKTVVATGTASANGVVRKVVVVPSSAHFGRTRVWVIGSAADRVGHDVLRLVRRHR